MLRSTNTDDTDKQVPKTPLRCLKSHMMLSANRLHRLRVLSKATQANNLKPSRNSLELSHPHQSNSPLTTQRMHNNAMPTTATTSNNMDCSKVPRASKMLPLPNDHSVDTVVLKLRELLNSHRVPLNKLHLVMQPLEVKEVDTTLPTRLLKLSSMELAKAPKAPNLNSPAPRNNLKLETILMAIHTTPARTMLHT